MRPALLTMLSAMLAAACATPASSPPATPAQPPSTAPNTAPSTAPKATNSVDKWRARTEDPECQRRLQALAQGQLKGWNGVGKCGRIDAERALGDSGDQPSKFEQFGEYRVYKAGKDSLLVWFLSDDIRVIQLLYPKLGQPLKALLGEPQAKIKSQLSADWDQWVYANRGLALHVRRANSEPVMLFAYAASTVEEFLKSDVARVARTESPVEELK